MKRTIIIVMAAMMAFASTGAASAASISAAETSAVFQKKKAQIETVVFKSDIHCSACAKKVQENIAFEKGVKGLEVSVENKTIKVTYDANKTSVEALKAAIKKLGYSAEVVK